MFNKAHHHLKFCSYVSAYGEGDPVLDSANACERGILFSVESMKKYVDRWGGIAKTISPT